MKRIFCVLSAAFFSSFAFAGWMQIPPTDFTLKPPPLAGSVEDIADIDAVLNFQADRTAQDCDMAAVQQNPTYESFYALRTVISEEESRRVRVLMEPVMMYAYRVSDHFKNTVNRPRPAQRDSRVRPCVTLTNQTSMAYPSGHATIGSLAACVLAQLYPQKSRDWADYGKYIGELRVISGVHHPSDVQEGGELGARICKRLLSEPDFQAELNALK